MPAGRPSLYTDDLARTICDRIASGESMRAICRDDGMPNQSTVLRWLDAREDFAAEYTRARALQAEHLADELVEIADGGSDDVQRDKLRVETRKWVAAKLRPHRYGDLRSVELTGKDGGPVEVESNRDVAKALLGLLGRGE